MKKKDIRDCNGEPLNDGDAVKLKTGTIEMIIHSFFKNQNGEYTGLVNCKWQDNLGMAQQESYPSTSLIKIL